MSSPALNPQAALDALVDAALKDGPQVVRRDGVEQAVVIPIEAWRQVQPFYQPTSSKDRRSLKEILLDPAGPHDIPIPARGRFRMRRSAESS
jgi:hypothetical protein